MAITIDNKYQNERGKTGDSDGFVGIAQKVCKDLNYDAGESLLSKVYLPLGVIIAKMGEKNVFFHFPKLPTCC